MPRVFVGIGSNIDRDVMIRAGVAELQGHFGGLQLSSVYESEAVGFAGAPFYNLVAAFDTEESIASVCATLRAIEQRHGRQRGEKRYSPRTLDIDLLLYGDLVTSGDGYRVPRDEISRHAFVLQPLAEIAPDLRNPRTGETFASLWAGFDKSHQRLRAIEFTW
jgi:2-amino-4-hydroxy-6-hydroxymethyldihydropteridine diphosphokinase